MSHELRTPLNAVLGFSQLLLVDSTGSTSDQQKNNVERIYQAGSHLLNLINEILDLARIESGKINLNLQPVNVVILKNELIESLQPMADKTDIQIIDEVSSDAPLYVRADDTRLRQVLLNLLSNAIKYNRVGGTVTIFWENVGKSCLRISVRDTGPGISEDQQGRLFEPFERLSADKTNISGTGIGLTIAKRMMQLMHGTIGLKSQPGQGSCFYIEIPLADAVQEKSQTGVSAQLNPASLVGKKKEDSSQIVLYVEDNFDNLDLVEKILKMRPHIRLFSAGLGQTGIELASKIKPDLILLDISLPDMSGIEVLSALKAQGINSEVPIIALSANAGDRDIQEALDAGFNHYITKPINISEFLETIDGFIEPSA